MNPTKKRIASAADQSHRELTSCQPDLKQLKQQCPMPTLMRQVGLEKFAKPNCRSPFRDDTNASWGIFKTDTGWLFKDHGTAESGDEITLLSKHLRLDQRKHFKLLLSVYQAVADQAGSDIVVSAPPASNLEATEPACLPDRTGFGPGTPAQHQQLATLRGFDLTAVDWAVERGVLVFGERRGLPCYGVCDKSGRLFEIRRLTGQSFPAGGELPERKSHALKHSQKNWPLGLLEAESVPALLLVEGVPDFIAAHELIAANSLQTHWAPVAMLSAGSRIAAAAAPHLKGKRVVIWFHNDPAHQGVKAAVGWQQQLQSSGAQVSLFDTGKLSEIAGVQLKDLNDYLRWAKSNQHPQIPVLTTMLTNL